MPIVQQGNLNTTALVVPDLYVQIVPPQTLNLNGVPSNILGVVGTATWGPVNTAVIVGDSPGYVAAFGSPQNRKYDMGTAVSTAIQQGAANFRCVRVTDGTDAAASVVIATSCITLTARYTGTTGNSIKVTFATGSKAATTKVIVSLPGRVPEVFDNIAGTANELWVNMAAAITAGTGPLRGPSQLITATAGAGTTAITMGANSLTGGTDGATTITSTVLVGADTIPRTGMYALRGQGCSIAVLADADDNTQWSAQAAFGLAEGIYMVMTGPAGDTITNAISTKATAGVDFYSAKLMFGDWLYWQDPFNAVLRLVSPQGFVAGRLANLSPEQSSLNKPLYAVVGSQKSGLPGSGSANLYSAAELQALFQVGIDVIANPQPGGSYWGVRLGHNSSSNPATNGDNYTRMTNYIAATLDAGMGVYVGQVINTTLFQRIKATLGNFLQNMLMQGQLGTLDGSPPFSVVCAFANNPLARTSLGYVQADVQVQYMGINEKFIVNLEGGQTVVIAKQAA